MRTHFPLTLGAVLSLFSLPAFANTDDAPREKPLGPYSQGRVVGRGGVRFNLNQTINLGGSNTAQRVRGGVDAGVGYFIIDNLSLDGDIDADFFVTPTPELAELILTPGTRLHVVRNTYLRAGMPVSVLPTFGLGVLVGAGYTQPIGPRAAFVVGVNYTYYLTEAFQRVSPNGKVDVRAGFQTHF